MVGFSGRQPLSWNHPRALGESYRWQDSEFRGFRDFVLSNKDGLLIFSRPRLYRLVQVCMNTQDRVAGEAPTTRGTALPWLLKQATVFLIWHTEEWLLIFFPSSQGFAVTLAKAVTSLDLPVAIVNLKEYDPDDSLIGEVGICLYVFSSIKTPNLGLQR